MQAKTIRIFSSVWSVSGVPVLKCGSVSVSMNGIRNSSLSRIDVDLVVRVEDLALVQAQRLDDVLVGVGVDRLLEGLAQQVLAALGRGDVPVGAEHDVVGRERVGGDEEAEVALDDAALVLGQPVRVLPQRDVAAHVDFLRHPVVGAGGEVLLPGPLVLERHQLVDVGAAVDDALVVDLDAAVARRAGSIGRAVRSRSRRCVVDGGLRRSAACARPDRLRSSRGFAGASGNIGSASERLRRRAHGIRSPRWSGLGGVSCCRHPSSLTCFALLLHSVSSRPSLADRFHRTSSRPSRRRTVGSAAHLGRTLTGSLAESGHSGPRSPRHPARRACAWRSRRRARWPPRSAAGLSRSTSPRASRRGCAGSRWSSGRAARRACRCRRSFLPEAPAM